MDLQKAQKGLIDKQGRRKYFKELNPKLLEKPLVIDGESIKNKKKILFIIPNFHWIDEDVNALWDLIPWNLCQIASVIDDICADVKIIDSYKDNLSEDELAKQIADYKPDIVGLTVLMDQYADVAPITTKIIKNISKNIITVLGGVYAMANPMRAMKDKNLDYVVIGEGEYVFKQLIGFYSGACDLPERGICFRKNGNEELENRGHSEFIKNLDDLPKPAYHLIDFLSYCNKYNDRKNVDRVPAYPYARIVTSRGCPEKCSFCQVPSLQGSYFRARSPDHVCDEIEWLKKEYGIKAIQFDDDNLATNTKRAKALFRRMIERGLTLPWVYSATAVFRLDTEMIDLMVESGCEYINVAIESGSERVTRDIVLKPLDYDHAKKMVAYAKKKGLFVAGNFIIGFPTETWEEIRKTINFAEEINVDYAKLFIAIPLRNTEMFDLAEKTDSIIMETYDADSMWSVGGLIKSKEWTADDLTILRAYEWDRINFSNPKKLEKIAKRMAITVEELNKIRRRTLSNAVKAISSRQVSKANVTKAADIALVI
jgi:radical SAM superfamily enzyme YgiQ (UPF0313 family)